MLPIKDIKNSQVFYAKASDRSPYSFKAWGDSYQCNEDGLWTIECTDSGDYCYTFIQTDENILYPTKELV